MVALRALSVDAILSEVPSLVFDIDFSEVLASIASVDGINIGTTFTATGWSLNSNGKPGPDIASLRCASLTRCCLR